MASPFQIPVTDLLHRPGSSRPVAVTAPLPDLHVDAAVVPDGTPVDVEVVLERIPEGIVVRGSVHARWQASCSRCLEPVGGDVDVHVDELYEPDPLEGETYPLGRETLDLEPMVRDALVLELPAAPLCAEACAGLCPSCGVNRNTMTCDCTTDDTDPRWDALRSLEI